MNSIYVSSLRLTLHLSSLLCRVNLNGRFKTKVTSRARRLLLHAVHIVNYCFLLAVAINVFLTYVYEFRRLELKENLIKQSSLERDPAWLSAHVNENGTLKQTSHSEVDELIDGVRTAKVYLKAVGAPYLEYSLLAAANCVALLVFSVSHEVFVPLYIRYVQPIESDLMSILTLGEGTGHKICLDMMQLELSRLEHKCHKFRNQAKGVQHTSIRTYLSSLQLSDELYPFNRRPDWLVRLSKIFCLIFIALTIYSAFLGFFLMVGLVKMESLQRYKLETDFRDLVQLVMEIYVVMNSGQAIMFYFSVASLIAVDQILTLKKLIKEVERCIRQGSIGPGSPLNLTPTANNQQLLQVFFQYRMFVKQTRKTLPSQGLFMVMLLQMGLVGPLIILLQARYMEPHMLLALNYGFAIILGAIVVFWLPFCYMQSRCQTLYRSLYSLAAHVANVQAHRGAYSWHLITLLAKELSDPHKLLDQMTVKKFGLSFTYTNALTYFWYAILLLITANVSKNFNIARLL